MSELSETKEYEAHKERNFLMYGAFGIKYVRESAADAMREELLVRIAELEAAANTSICIFCHEIMAKDLTVIMEHAAGCEERPENRLMARIAELEATIERLEVGE